jgi:hypothetical protein
MTEAEWLACEDPERLLVFLRGTARERKLRLFACACCRRVWHLLTDADSRAAAEAAERFADGLERKGHLSTVRARARRVTFVQRGAAYIAWRAAFDKLPSVISSIARGTVYNAAAHPGGGWRNWSDVEQESVAVAALLRDIFGNPFHPVAVDPTWLTSTVVQLAEQMYDSRDFSAMPILGDALMDAGCFDEAIQTHCRGPGPHVRGCHIVDACLGKS